MSTSNRRATSFFRMQINNNREYGENSLKLKHMMEIKIQHYNRLVISFEKVTIVKNRNKQHEYI